MPLRILVRWLDYNVTFEFVDEIQQCDHSIETCLEELLHDTICLFVFVVVLFFSINFSKMKLGNFVECWLRPLSTANHSVVYNFCAFYCFVFDFILYLSLFFFNGSAEHFGISLLCPAPLYNNFKLMVLAGTHTTNTKTSDLIFYQNKFVPFPIPKYDKASVP